ncbi:integrase family protein [Parafrankia sp. EAN1pec]|nr:integrase family protein [Frankia sp. EAN1pec]
MRAGNNECSTTGGPDTHPTNLGDQCNPISNVGEPARTSAAFHGRKRTSADVGMTVSSAWTAERAGNPGDPLFPTITGRPLSRDAIERRIALYTARAAASCPSISTKHVTAHTLRHTAAMRLLLAGVDQSVIALWLGHAHIATTDRYLHADMTQKEQALARTQPFGSAPGHYRPPDPLLAFLENL